MAVLTTLCYLEKDSRYLMMLRNKKPDDVNKGKWIGVGGKFEPGETPEECLIREIREETGFCLRRFCFRGIITFVYETKPAEYIFVYTSSDFDCTQKGTCGGSDVDSRSDLPTPVCAEGEFRWIPKSEIMKLELWEGDRFMLERLLADDFKPFSLKFGYDDTGRLTGAWDMSVEPVRLW